MCSQINFNYLEMFCDILLFECYDSIVMGSCQPSMFSTTKLSFIFQVLHWPQKSLLATAESCIYLFWTEIIYYLLKYFCTHVLKTVSSGKLLCNLHMLSGVWSLGDKNAIHQRIMNIKPLQTAALSHPDEISQLVHLEQQSHSQQHWRSLYTFIFNDKPTFHY